MPSKSKSNKSGAKRRTPTSNKMSATTASAPVEETPTPVEVAPVEAAPVEVAPVEAVAAAQTGGSKRKGKKQKAASPAVTETVTATETEQVTEAFTETATATDTETVNGRRTRSFKVLLPTSSEYEGRFTGLTPYQAAHKALSKYYRETSKPKKEIQFSIRESTRGSKRSIYTYNGRREKLKTPVEYSIKDGRTIVKHYKNRLIKVKKAELVETAPASA